MYLDACDRDWYVQKKPHNGGVDIWDYMKTCILMFSFFLLWVLLLFLFPTAYCCCLNGNLGYCVVAIIVAALFYLFCLFVFVFYFFVYLFIFSVVSTIILIFVVVVIATIASVVGIIVAFYVCVVIVLANIMLMF